jgi:hypothetical protein
MPAGKNPGTNVPRGNSGVPYLAAKGGVKEQRAATPRQPKLPEPRVQTQLGRAAVPLFAANDRINQMLIEHLGLTAWRAKPPGKVRTIAAIFTHMHNVRCKWVRLTAPHLKVPRQLNRTHCTPQQARAGLAESAARCTEMLAEALGGGEGRVEKFRRDGWGRPWPVGPEMLCYCFLTKPTIAGRCVCSRISSDSRCLPRRRPGSGIGKSCGKSAARSAAPATILDSFARLGKNLQLLQFLYDQIHQSVDHLMRRTGIKRVAGSSPDEFAVGRCDRVHIGFNLNCLLLD